MTEKKAMNPEIEAEVKEVIGKYLNRTNVMRDFGGINPEAGFNHAWGGNGGKALCEDDRAIIKKALNELIPKLIELKDKL